LDPSESGSCVSIEHLLDVIAESCLSGVFLLGELEDFKDTISLPERKSESNKCLLGSRVSSSDVLNFFFKNLSKDLSEFIVRLLGTGKSVGNVLVLGSVLEDLNCNISCVLNCNGYIFDVASDWAIEST
jgi:hypothetical protein